MATLFIVCIATSAVHLCLSRDITTSKNNKALDCYMYVCAAMAVNDVLHESVDLKCYHVSRDGGSSQKVERCN